MRITVRGARENNLTGVDLDLPRGSLVVFCGVSGSGKSSLAFDTLHAEGQRRYLEALAGSAGAGLARPDVDAIDGLPPTIALDQRMRAPSSRDMLASFAELHPVLRVLFARSGVQLDPATGEELHPQTHDEIVAQLLGLPEGTRLTIESPLQAARGGDPTGLLDEVRRAGFSRVRVNGEIRRLDEVSEVGKAADLRIVVDRVKVEPDRRARLHDAVRTATAAGRGVVIGVTPDGEIVFMDRPLSMATGRELPALEPKLLSPDSPAGWCPSCRGSGSDGEVVCPTCEGSRLREEATAVRFEGVSLPELLAWTVSELALRVDGWARDEVTSLPIDELQRRCAGLVQLGLGGLRLDRGMGTLSSGELQRVRLAKQVGARLSGVLYVLDEPSAGLGGPDVAPIVALITSLRQQGNTVVVVDHHPSVIRAADRVVEFGPGPGKLGGTIVYDGDVAGLMDAPTPTGRWLSGRDSLPTAEARQPSHWVRSGDREIPLGVLVAVAGPSGSGKSRLLTRVTQGIEGKQGITHLIDVDRGAVARSRRSNPATYSGVWDVVRELMAATRESRIRGFEASTFSLNLTGGRCEACKGTGVQRVDLQLLPDVFLECEVCGGRRYNADVLEVRWKGHTAAELLDMTVAEAHPILSGHPKLDVLLRILGDVGLDYLELGQPAHTLSGGEAQRLKLARELARTQKLGVEGRLYVIDDPTVGLHPADVSVLLGVLRRLVERGASVWMATHSEPLAAAADHRIDLGGWAS